MLVSFLGFTLNIVWCGVFADPGRGWRRVVVKSFCCFKKTFTSFFFFWVQMLERKSKTFVANCRILFNICHCFYFYLGVGNCMVFVNVGEARLTLTYGDE